MFRRPALTYRISLIITWAITADRHTIRRAGLIPIKTRTLPQARISRTRPRPVSLHQWVKQTPIRAPIKRIRRILVNPFTVLIPVRYNTFSFVLKKSFIDWWKRSKEQFFPISNLRSCLGLNSNSNYGNTTSTTPQYNSYNSTTNHKLKENTYDNSTTVASSTATSTTSASTAASTLTLSQTTTTGTKTTTTLGSSLLSGDLLLNALFA